MEMLEKTLDDLLAAVQLGHVFPDGKTFVDAAPRFAPEIIAARYSQACHQPGFSLREFVLEHYDLPQPLNEADLPEGKISIEENISRLWDILTRKPAPANGSLIALPYPYIVPGGRFGEIYYWDSYFTMLGLQAAGRIDMIENMISNFSHLIDQFGYIPNGNRTYFLGRSQPPFYSLIIRLLAEVKGTQVLADHFEHLLKEYSYWMKGAGVLGDELREAGHCVRLPGNEIMNRYWDESDTPRPESYREDVELAATAKANPAQLYRHLRAGAESGWDFSGRWFGKPEEFGTIHTTDIIPVDLNALLFYLEETIAGACRIKGMTEQAESFYAKATARKNAIDRYCWNEKAGFYFDYDWKSGQQKSVYSLAAVYPLYFGIASRQQAAAVAAMIEKDFLKEGGVLTSTIATGQQWDAPNGWAPLQWLTITGLERYQHQRLAGKIAKRWMKLNNQVYQRTGKLMEKYNVVDTHLEAGGGEYPGQDGFGWTNGVLLALIKKYGNSFL